jgi:APA family basic amino acid/polyamine antiporter
MMLTNPRVMFAMSEEGTMPKSFKKVHPKTEVLSYSLTVFTIVTIFTLFYAKEFDQILNYIIFLDSIGMAFSAATLFYFRYKKIEPEEGNYFKISLYPILPIFYILAYILIAYAVYISDQKAALYGMGIFALFFVLYWIVDFVNKGKNKDQV